MVPEPIELGPDALVGSYRIVKEIGRGGMGTVYEARHTALPRRAAVKVMHGELRRHPGMATRMVQEASILEDIRHPGVVRVYECSLLADRRPWIAMELVEGETLANRLSYATRLRGIEVARLLAQVADVLAAVHPRGVIHRDLKPENLLLTPTDRDFPLRLIDWGVARLGPLGRLTLDGLTPGTPIYMSPEQAIGKDIAAPCDIYSLGVIAYEALTGRPPFDGRTLAEVVSMHLTSEAAPLVERCAAPAELCRLIHRMLDKEPRRRPCSTEVRRVTRAMAQDATSAAYEEFLCAASDPRAKPRATIPPRVIPPRPHAPHAPVVRVQAPPQAQRSPSDSDEAVVVDPETLERGTTEMMPVMPRPRWTPDPVAAVAGVPEAPRVVIRPRVVRQPADAESSKRR